MKSKLLEETNAAIKRLADLITRSETSDGGPEQLKQQLPEIAMAAIEVLAKWAADAEERICALEERNPRQ